MLSAETLLVRLRPALSPAAFSLLEPVVRLSGLSERDGEVICTFPHASAVGLSDDEHAEEQLRLLPPAPSIDRRTPAALRRFLEVCGGLQKGIVGSTGQLVLHDGFDGTLSAGGRDLWNERRTRIAWSPDLCAPIDMDQSAYYVFHPTNGRLYLCDEYFEEVQDTSDPVEVYLREVHLSVKSYQPVTPLEKAVANTPARHEWVSSEST